MKLLELAGLRTHLKGLLVPLLAALALASCTPSAPLGEPVPVAAGEGIMTGFRNAQRLVVYEGLPHQAKERRLMEREATREDVTRIFGYPFYTPAVPAKDQRALQRILGSPGNFGIYTGPKTCGGFHPDYAVSWTSGGRPQHMLICFGCGEVLLSDGRSLLPYDLDRTAWAGLRGLLDRHASKRPPAAR